MDYEAGGRTPIGVVQPPGGASPRDYPFVLPSDDIRYLFADLYVNCNSGFHLPLRVDWLYGFGDQVVVAPPGYPAPVNAKDIIIKDANGLTVFDSTADDVDFVETAWSSRLTVLEWSNPQNVCRAVIHTKWSNPDENHDYDTYIVPDNGVLDERAVEFVPWRVTSIGSDSVAFSGDINFEPGINLVGELTTKKEGLRNISRIKLSVDRTKDGKDNCGADAVYSFVRTINGVYPKADGQFRLDCNDCLRSQINADSSVSPAVLSGSPGLTIHDNCTVCCSCDDYFNTLRAVHNVWKQNKESAEMLVAARDQYETIIACWEAAQECRTSSPLRIAKVPRSGCKVSLGGILCNVTKCPLTDVVLRFTFQLYDGATLVPSPSAGFTSVYRQSSTNIDPHTVPLGGSWPVVYATVDRIEPGQNGLIRFVLALSPCLSTYTLKITVTAHVTGHGDCVLPTASIPGDITALWTAASLTNDPVANYLKSEAIALE